MTFQSSSHVYNWGIITSLTISYNSNIKPKSRGGTTDYIVASGHINVLYTSDMPAKLYKGQGKSWLKKQLATNKSFDFSVFITCI